MQVTINANGKNIQAEISEEQAKILGLITDKPKTGYERGEECNDEYYYLVDVDSEVKRIKKTYSTLDRDCYDTGNYYSNQTIAKSNARADMLFRRLRQWQASHDKAITLTDWETNTNKYKIKYNYVDNCPFVCIERNLRDPNIVYFSSNKKAEEAIEQFADELIWYFTEYVQRLDEAQNG